MVLPAIPLVLAGAARALGSAAVRKLMKQGISQDAIRKMAGKEASKKAYKKLKRGQFRRSRDRANEEKFKNVKTQSQVDKIRREENQDIQAIAEGGMRNPRLFGLKMKEGGKVKGQTGTQSGKVEDIFARIKKLDERFPRNIPGSIPNQALRNERKKLDRLEMKALGVPIPKSKAEKEKIKLLNKKIDDLKAKMGLQKGKTGTQSGKAQDATARLEQLKDKYPTASKFSATGRNRVLEPFSSSLRDYGIKKDKLSRIKKRQDKEAEVRSDNRRADSVSARIAGYRDDLTKEERRNKRAKIKSDLQDSYARIRGESKAQSGGMKAGGKVKKMRAGGPIGNGKKKADGIALRGKTRCKMR